MDRLSATMIDLEMYGATPQSGDLKIKVITKGQCTSEWLSRRNLIFKKRSEIDYDEDSRVVALCDFGLRSTDDNFDLTHHAPEGGGGGGGGGADAQGIEHGYSEDKDRDETYK